MKAIVWTKYGSPEGLQLQEVEKPAPKGNEVRVKIQAATVTAGDCEMRSLQFPFYLALPIRLFAGLRKPTRIRILGMELAGDVDAVGKDVRRFKEGDPVFGMTGFGFGAYAEYICLPEEPGDMDGPLALKPTTMSYEEAAAVPVGGLEALHFLRKANIQPGQKVLINGAGGSIGTFGIQLAKHYGAEVTAVDSTGKLDTMRSIGADRVIDYTQEDFTKHGETYDVIFDVVGQSPFARSMKSLNPNGIYLIANPRLPKMLRKLWASRMSNKTVILETSSPTTEDLEFLKDLIEAGTLKSVIDRRYPLEEVAEAHRYVETGQKKGSVVITVAHND
jgi:NADPH:quinone reductase-like Zn-dependent oxidoreductase